MTLIYLNGSETSLPKKVKTLHDLYTHLSLSPRGRVLELNQNIIQEKELSTRYIQNKDYVEIIQFMGGGA